MLEMTVQWGEDTRCIVCLDHLTAGTPYYRDGDGELCTDCATAEDQSLYRCPDCGQYLCMADCPNRVESYTGPLTACGADGVYASNH